MTKALGTLARNEVKVQEVRALVMLLQNAFWSFKAPSVTQVVAEMCEQWWMWGDEDALGPARERAIGL